MKTVENTSMKNEIARNTVGSCPGPRAMRGGASWLAIALLAAASTAAVAAIDAAAQGVPIDRWLVSNTDAVTAENPLSNAGALEFPDRDLAVGPGTWTLVRRDGETRFDFSDLIESGQAALAHAYVRAPSDANFRVTIDVEACASLAAWVNGQPLHDKGGAREVRLAGGWNTLFAVVDGDAGCPRSLSASISGSRAPLRQDDVVPTSELRVQASRPPGVAPNYPEGTVTAGAPAVTSLSWSPGRNDLDVALDYSVTAWGRGGGAIASESDEERGPPTVDLSGDWNLTLYGPTGIQQLIARFDMEEDGALTGELRRDKRDLDPRRSGPQFGQSDTFEGRIRDGWVSGTRFGFTLRVPGRRGGELKFTGELRDGELSGPVDFAGFREVASRFEARRSDEDAGSEAEPAAATEEDPDALLPSTADVPAAGDPAAGDHVSGDHDTRTGPSDPNGRRRQMVSFLLGNPPAKAPAPSSGSIRIKVAGESLTGAADALVAATPYRFEGILPFRKVRDAALRPDGVEAEIKWEDDDIDVKGGIGADGLLEAFHAPIVLGGLIDRGDGVSTAVFRVPDVLGGFTLRGAGGQWWIDGTEATAGVLCDPCRRGQEVEIGFRPTGSEPAMVQLADHGYPESAASGPSAADWLRALEGDNRKYRELTGG